MGKLAPRRDQEMVGIIGRSLKPTILTGIKTCTMLNKAIIRGRLAVISQLPLNPMEVGNG